MTKLNNNVEPSTPDISLPVLATITFTHSGAGRATIEFSTPNPDTIGQLWRVMTKNVSLQPNDLDRREMLRRYELGRSPARIGDELGFSRSVVELQLTLQGVDLARSVRRWARDAGYEVGRRGRIPREVREAYEIAHRSA